MYILFILVRTRWNLIMVLNFSNWNMLGMNGYSAMGGFGSACNGYSSG